MAAPFAYRDRRVAETVTSGIPEIDRLTGGLPRGGLTEICGPPGSGRTSLLLAALAARTAEGEACALVDGRDALDPYAAEAAGVRLERLLWVRCRDIEQALRATDLLLRGGGFGLIAVDLADIEPRMVRGVTLNTWFRFRRAVEDTPSILLLVAQESNAKTCASLVLKMEAGGTRWERTGEKGSCNDPWNQLLAGFGVRAELAQIRVKPVEFCGAPPQRAREVNFQTRTEWDYVQSA